MFKQGPFRTARNVVGVSSLSSSLAHGHRHWDFAGTPTYFVLTICLQKAVDTKASLLDNWLLHWKKRCSRILGLCDAMTGSVVLVLGDG